MASEAVRIKSEEMCRLCLSDESLEDIFSDQSLPQWISEFLSIKVSIHDHMSRSICTICRIRVSEIREFQVRCQDVQAVLRSMLGQGSVSSSRLPDQIGDVAENDHTDQAESGCWFCEKSFVKRQDLEQHMIDHAEELKNRKIAALIKKLIRNSLEGTLNPREKTELYEMFHTLNDLRENETGLNEQAQSTTKEAEHSQNKDCQIIENLQENVCWKVQIKRNEKNITAQSIRTKKPDVPSRTDTKNSANIGDSEWLEVSENMEILDYEVEDDPDLEEEVASRVVLIDSSDCESLEGSIQPCTDDDDSSVTNAEFDESSANKVDEGAQRCSKRIRLTAKNNRPNQLDYSDYLSPSELKCVICNKAFSVESALREHDKLVHGLTINYECAICKERFALRDLLKAHLSGHYLNGKLGVVTQHPTSTSLPGST